MGHVGGQLSDKTQTCRALCVSALPAFYKPALLLSSLALVKAALTIASFFSACSHSVASTLYVVLWPGLCTSFCCHHCLRRVVAVTVYVVLLLSLFTSCFYCHGLRRVVAITVYVVLLLSLFTSCCCCHCLRRVFAVTVYVVLLLSLFTLCYF